jgi:hypothetical protein
MSKPLEETYLEREKRVSTTIQLKVPDRVPIAPLTGFFPAKYYGITCEEVMYNYGSAYEAWKKTIMDFDWDMIVSPHYAYSGPTFESLDFKQLKWPGRGVDPNYTYQFIEREYMKLDEYEAFLEDPSDWMIRSYLPRICGVLEPLQKLPPIRTSISYYLGLFNTLASLGSPEITDALESLIKAAREAHRWRGALASFRKEMADLGYPFLYAGDTHAPFDTIGDFFRGTHGIMLDMFRNPDLLLEAIEKITPTMIQMGTSAAETSGNPRICIPLHKGSRDFISLDQFVTFYWPSLRRVMLELIEKGCIPYLLLEGDFTDRLDVIREVPKGKVIYHLERTDIFKAKEVLGDRVCIKGNVPNTLLCLGTPKEVENYCKRLIDVVGHGGGFIMDAGAVIDEAKPKNMRAMTRFTKNYGVYRK